MYYRHPYLQSTWGVGYATTEFHQRTQLVQVHLSKPQERSGTISRLGVRRGAAKHPQVGGYMVARVDETPEQIMARALIVAQETISRQKAAVAAAEKRATLLEATTKQMTVQINGLETKNKELLPGATFAKAVETSEHSILIGELARIIKQNGVEIGQNRLFQWLRENGFLCKKGEWYNQPTQRAMEMGLFEIKKTVITKPSGDSLVTTTTKVTGKGQIYFVNRFLYEKSKRNDDKPQMGNESSEKGGAQ